MCLAVNPIALLSTRIRIRRCYLSGNITVFFYFGIFHSASISNYEEKRSNHYFLGPSCSILAQVAMSNSTVTNFGGFPQAWITYNISIDGSGNVIVDIDYQWFNKTRCFILTYNTLYILTIYYIAHVLQNPLCCISRQFKSQDTRGLWTN